VDKPWTWNRDTAEELADVEELPRQEVLARLYSIVATYEASERAGGCLCPLSEIDAARGLSAPHKLRYGCCRGRRTDDAVA
jgi:hypothetical protein